MSVVEIDLTVREVAALVLGRAIAPGEAVSRATEEAWDSLKHVELLFAVEDATGVRFEQDELAELNDVDSIVTSVQRHRGA